MNRLLLRFGNQLADTVPEHRAVIDESGQVWWGWWAKAWERIPTPEEWTQIEQHVVAGAEIGLFDRRSLRYYIATCSDMHRATDDDGRVGSPDPSCTPQYYADDYFPVWFNVSAITSIDEVQFRSDFGFVPMADDQTLFWEDPSSPPEQDTVEVVRTAGRSILHISDLHFGDDFGFPGEDDTGREVLEATLGTYLRDSRSDIGAVVVSGDLITRGVERFFRDAGDFLERLLAHLGLDRSHLVVVPGNHDLWLEDAANFTYSHAYKHELGYRSWYDSFFAQGGANLKLERIKLLECPGDLNLGFLQVNSARLRERETMEFGFVGSHRYMGLLRVLDEIDRKNFFRFFVMHHHLIPVPGTEGFGSGRPVSVTVDAGRIIEDLQRFNVDVVLHGHQHLPFLGAVARRSLGDFGSPDSHMSPLYVLGAGSLSAKHDRLTDELRVNSFNIYDFADDAMGVSFVEITPGGTVRTAGRSTVPLRDR